MKNFDYQSSYIIIDMGTSSIKCGFSTDPCPRLIVPNVYSEEMVNDDFICKPSEKEYHYGIEALKHCATSTLTYPQRLNKIDDHSLIVRHDVDRLEGMLSYIFHSLGDKQLSNNVFIVDNFFTPLKFRQDLAKLLFDTFSVANLRIEPQEIMTLYATSKQSGLIVESGELNTIAVPIYEGYIINNGVIFNDIAGEALTKEFLKHYKQKFDYYNVKSQFELAKKIKEEFSEVSLDLESTLKEEKYNVFELPDGNCIDIGNERYTIPEIMFNPEIIGMDKLGVHKMVNLAISKCESFVKSELYGHIILGGGNSVIKNYPERLANEVKKEQKEIYYPKDTDKPPEIDVEYNKETKYSGWIGGGGICSYFIQNKWISRNDIDEGLPYEQESVFKANPLDQKYIYL